MGSVAVAYRLSCPMAGGVFLDQGLNLCPLHWQAGSQPLDHQGSPSSLFLQKIKKGSLIVSQFFFFFLTSALFLIFTWTSFSNTSTVYLLLSSGFAPTTLLSVQSLSWKRTLGCSFQEFRDHFVPILMILLCLDPSAICEMRPKILLLPV